MSKDREQEVLRRAERNVRTFEQLSHATDLPPSVREECRKTAEYNRKIAEKYRSKKGN